MIAARGTHAGDPDPPLDAALGDTVNHCRTQIIRFQRNPTPARIKRNIHGRLEPVTDLDLQLQDLLTQRVRTLWPHLPIIAEENRTALEPLPADCIVLDPLDGTLPLLAGQPFFAIAVCLIRHGRPAQALIDLPAYRVRITATPTELHTTGEVNQLPSFSPDTLLTSPRHTALATRLLAEQGRPRPTLQAIPTATVKMALVALRCAQAAVYLPSGSGAAPWDYAAAALAVAASGGTVRDNAGRDLARTLPRPVSGWQATACDQRIADLDVLLRVHQET